MISHTLRDISNLMILTAIFIFMFMLIGMEIYAYKIKFGENFPKTNFNSPLEAFIAVFIVIANDGWTKIYFDHYRAGSPALASVFFLSLIVLG